MKRLVRFIEPTFLSVPTAGVTSSQNSIPDTYAAAESTLTPWLKRYPRRVKLRWWNGDSCCLK